MDTLKRVLLWAVNQYRGLWQRSTGDRRVWVIIGTVLVPLTMFTCVCGLCAQVGSKPRNTAQSSPTAVAVAAELPTQATATEAPTTEPATPTTAPSQTPVPTEAQPTEPPPPTEPPAPTEPAPTDTPEAKTMPADVLVYVAVLNKATSPASDALGTLGELCSNPDPASDEWVLSMALQMAIIQKVHEDVMAIEDVPTDMAKIHATVVSGTSDLSQSMTLLAQGIDNVDPDKVAQGSELMKRGSQRISEAGRLIEEYRAQYE